MMKLNLVMLISAVRIFKISNRIE